jgi:hypothetical protein
VLVQQLLWSPRCCRQHAEMVKESLRPCEFGGRMMARMQRRSSRRCWRLSMRRGPICRRTGSARTRSSLGCSRRLTIRRSSPLSPLMVTRWPGARPSSVSPPGRRGSFSQGPGRARPAVFAVNHLALVMDAERSRLRAVRENMPQLRQLGVAVPFHKPGDVITTTPAARRALDRQGRDEKVRERVRVVSHLADR